MAGDAVKHDYHLVNPSPWPLVGSGAAFVMMLGAVIWMRSDNGGLAIGGATLSGPWVFLIGFSAILYTMYGWWRDIVGESLRGENTTPVVRIGFRYGMVLFIASEVMFFVAWFWAFFNAALFNGPNEAVILADGATQMLNADGLPAYLGDDGEDHRLVRPVEQGRVKEGPEPGDEEHHLR
ncbi:MAG: cytochrome c oxidase subunit 3, partial [Pseudomonadota bacterium]